MKAYIIIINWTLSIFGLGIESTDGTVWGTLIGFAWFALSTMILIRADKKGTMNKLDKLFKIDEL